MKFVSFPHAFLLTAALVLGACAQPEGEIGSAQPAAKLDMSKGPNKVTGDDYRLQPVATGDGSLVSIDADGNVAPFGMASRAARDVAAAPVPEPVAAAAAAPAVFTAQCTACHGIDARGVQGLGVDLTASTLVADSSEAELVEFLKVGRMPTDPASVTGIPMPGFAWLAPDDLAAVAAHLKTL